MSLSFLAQLQAAAKAASEIHESPQRFNPNPPGVLRPEGSSVLVLKCLRDHGGFFSEGQIRFRTGLNHARTSWALIYLGRQGLIESREDPTRNSRYRKYRACPDKSDDPATDR